MPFEITDDGDGQYQVTKASTSNVKTVLPKFSDGDNFKYVEFREGNVSGHLMLYRNSLGAAVDINLDGEITGPFSGSLKDGILVKFDGPPEKVQVFLRNGGEVWVKIGEKEKKVTTVY